MRKTSLALLAVASLGLGACGYSTGDRAVSGGLLGAGAGAAIGSLSGSAGTGALIGGAAGAAGGALTSGNDINLGRPVWR
ncbi:YMGG-like Gly-zipper [Roseomonas rosea]|uniref:YMGG-like Gly-zipper n=1 Tax=Muricoccus roseus TaxID=198092 RepID=A0A1M6QT59_9PROT|nr:YMGG-like glycine zipper-containing protein [Roseomonas rosea]SHK23386.1 YMGG-like Gly-zipper [Roseomonas rosea]